MKSWSVSLYPARVFRALKLNLVAEVLGVRFSMNIQYKVKVNVYLLSHNPKHTGPPVPAGCAEGI